ncbi:hypothetical protein TanjilG_14982 [Lupinus angustifolius]|uniref:Protein SHORTAGE IN CHIASMATA 1 n=1 Tax=Lupinus angustifolius TaxID=3871 RepID=A0A4P1RA99_LUPAN|nr:PREDICTED: uncharacterized protein LOC109353605 [Lupinus angustifolius]OIW06337.1 hypothetical protein TanjilG_14982 [Lupinus angustifolius]
MRTRFLNNDYFTLPPSQPFLHLPVPRLPSPSSAVNDLLNFDSSIYVSNHIDTFPIDTALSTFLSAVIPHKIHLQFPDTDAATATAPFSKPDNLESKTVGFSDQNEISYGTVQFEIPELDALLENACFTEMERMQMLCQTPEVENMMEMPKPEPNPSMQYPYEALESVCFLEDVISEYLKGENAYSVEDNISVQHLPHSSVQNKFLTLELDEESLGIPTCLSVVEIVRRYFENTRPENFDEQYQSITEGKEILGSMNYNMMKFFSNDCLSKESLVLSDVFSESNFINLLEIEHVDWTTALQGTLQVDSALLLNLANFDEFVFLEENIIQTFESFYETKALDDLETGDWMFKKEFNFKNFEELIVSNEIALIDDTFKSLPVPVISDYKMTITMHDVIEELFSKLKTRPLSTSDGIYLNWDLLEEDKCNIKISNFFQNILAKIDMNTSDFRGKSFDYGMLVFDLIFSDDTIGECDIKQSEELQKLLSQCMSLPDIQPVEFASAKTLERGSSKQGSQEQLPEINADKASLLYKSMSEISNLDYLLNPEKAPVKGDCNFVAQSTNNNVSVPKRTVRGDCTFAVKSTNANVSVLKVRSTELKAGPQSQQLHTVDLDDHATLKALCDGVEMPPNTELLLESESQFIFNAKGSLLNQKLERLVNFCPVEQSYDIKSSNVAPEADSFVPLIPAAKADDGHHSMEPGTVVIVNTQNVDKEMIVFRRSSYQVILAMEKGGIQVVERDLDLPVDIILSSAICLVWYDSRNLGKKATPMTETSSSLPSCIENIATDVLSLLSFYFRGCFLVFEGEFNFISTVMESSDGLYAAASSLGIDLQVFLSYSPELTNEVIVSCIKSATNLTRGLYPKMPESVTLAESFLTKFPGINPLTAHSILSLGITLNKFLELSHEQRMHILEKYHVPEESISLFSIFCKYGEREDSKSILTDCSSVSSGPDSDKCHSYQVDNERKRKYPFSGYQRDESYFDELLDFETLLDSSTLPKPCDLGVSNDARNSSDLTKTNFPMSDFSGQNRSASATTMSNPCIVSQSLHDQWNCKAPQISDYLEQPCLSLKNKGLTQNGMMDTATMTKNLNWHSHGNYEKLHEDIVGKVVDFTDSPLLDKRFSISDSMYFPSLVNETEKDHLRSNKIARRLSFDNSRHQEANSSKIWSSLKDTGLKDDNYPKPDFGKDAFPLDFKYGENIFEEGLNQASMRNLQGIPFQEEMSHLSETPLSHALRSASPLKNSPFTTKFLKRIKEKGIMRQRSLSCEKRRSPSVFDFFKYQPSRSTPGNIPEHKKLKKSAPPYSDSVKKGRYHASLTPNDKISKKKLTFGRNESGGQTKLVWGEGNKLGYQTK